MMKSISKRRHDIKRILGLALCVVMLSSATAQGFGTVSLLGQNTEHEKITRLALECGFDDRPICFETVTLDSLAGKKGTFGAVGAPDPGPTVFRFFAHCSGGDFLRSPDYPRSEERAKKSLIMCRNYIIYHFRQAVKKSDRLLDKDRNIRKSQVPNTLPCGYAEGVDKRAKCEILKHFGAALHAAQDFYAHSNWVDIADQTKPIGKTNPPGLAKRGRAPWLDLRISEPEFPEGLISGCGGIDAVTDGEGGCVGKKGKKRVDHATLNKDNGYVIPGRSLGKTPRGVLNDNFQFAVDAAIEETGDKWQTLIESLIITYGETDGAKIVCAIRSDSPTETCE